jgi:hypothetical protein
MVDAASPELLEAWAVGQLVRDAGGEHDLARRHGLLVFEDHLEGPVRSGDPRRPLRPVLDAGVRLQLPAPDLQQLARVRAVARKETVHAG